MKHTPHQLPRITPTRTRSPLPGWAWALFAVPLLLALFGFAAWLDRDLIIEQEIAQAASADYLAGRAEGEGLAREHLGEVAQAAYRQGQVDALEAVTSIPEGTPLPQICARLAPMLQQVAR